MNAQQMLLDYAAKKNNHKDLTAEQFIGKAVAEGVRIANNANGDIVVARVRREGKTIIVTETVKAETVSGKMETVNEIFRANID